MKTKPTPAQHKPTIEQFLAAFRRAQEGLREACEILARLVEENPRTFDELAAKHGFDYNILSNMLKVGNGEMDVRLLTQPHARPLYGLPLQTQAEVIDNGVDVAIIAEGERVVVEKKKLQDLTPIEVKTVFPNGHIAPIEEQVSIIKARKASRQMVSPRYEIHEDGRVKFYQDSEFTAAQIQEIATRAQEKAKQNLGRQLKKNQITR